MKDEYWDKGFDYLGSKVWYVFFISAVGFLLPYIIANQFFNNELWVLGIVAVLMVAVYGIILFVWFFVGGAVILAYDWKEKHYP